MQNGDSKAVGAMFKILENNVPNAPGITLTTFKEQLRDEYGVDVDSIGDQEEAPQPTQEELEIAYKIMLKSKR